MKRSFAIVIAIVVVIGLVIGGTVMYKLSSPEYTLAKTISDVKQNGVEGLESHLTDSAREKVEAIAGWTDNKLVSGILSLITPDDGISFLKSRLSEVEWTVKDILKGRKRTDVVIGFQYDDSISGSVDVTMVQDKGEWKIDGIGMPQFNTLSIP